MEVLRLFIKYFLYRRRHFSAFASTGRFPGGPASANFFLSMLGRNGSSARPISPRSRLLQLQQENKKKFLLLKYVRITMIMKTIIATKKITTTKTTIIMIITTTMTKRIRLSMTDTLTMNRLKTGSCPTGKANGSLFILTLWKESSIR